MGLNKKRTSEISTGSLNAFSIILEYKHELDNLADNNTFLTELTVIQCYTEHFGPASGCM